MMSNPGTLSIEIADGSQTTTAETLAVGVYADGERLPATEALGGRLRALCERVVSEGEFKGEEETTLLIHAPADGDGEGADEGTRGAMRVLLVGLGSRKDFDASALRRAAGAAVRAARTRS